MAIEKAIVFEIIRLAERGDTKRLGRLVKNLNAIETSQFVGFIEILNRANTLNVQDDYPSPLQEHVIAGAKVLIEALIQRGDGEPLAELGLLSWKTVKDPPFSIRSLDAAVKVGPLRKIYELCFRYGTGKNASAPETIESSAYLMLALAKAGCEDAFFSAGGILRDGRGAKKDLEGAAHWFHEVAYRGSQRAWIDLGLVPEAFEELSRIHAKKPRNSSQIDPVIFFSHQAAIKRKAREQLFVFLPGDEVEALVAGGESGLVEFKEMVNPHTRAGLFRSIAAFLNSSGGNLLIGITDKHGKAVGLGQSYKALNVTSRDGFARHLVDKIQTQFVHMAMLDISIAFPPLHGQEICQITVKPSQTPVFLKEEDHENFYIRAESSSRKLPESQISHYCARRWPKD